MGEVWLDEKSELKEIARFTKRYCPRVSAVNIGKKQGWKTWTFTFDWNDYSGKRNVHHTALDEHQIAEEMRLGQVGFFQAVTICLRQIPRIQHLVKPYIKYENTRPPERPVYKPKRRIRIRR